MPNQRNKQTQPIKIKNIEENNWRTNAEISNDYNAYQAKLLDVLFEFQHMWDRHFGEIRAGEHRVELTPVDERSINSESCRAGPRTRGFEKQETDKVLPMDVIEPA